MRALRMAWECLCILGLLCVAFVLLPFWWGWLAWQWRVQYREAVGDANLTDWQRGRGRHYDTTRRVA